MADTGLEVYEKLDAADIFIVDRNVDGTMKLAGSLSAAVAEDATALTLAVAATIADTKVLMIVSSVGAELVTVDGAVAASTAVTIADPGALFAHPAGAKVYLMKSERAGYIDGGVQYTSDSKLRAIRAANASGPIAYVPDRQNSGEQNFSFGLKELTGKSLQYGFAAQRVDRGTGTAADPKRVGIGPAQAMTIGLGAVRTYGTLVDGSAVTQDFCGAQFEVAVDTTLGGSNDPVTKVSGKYRAVNQYVVN